MKESFFNLLILFR